MAVTVTNAGYAIDTTASSVESSAFTCTAGNPLVCIVWYGDAEFATFTTPTGFTSGGVLTRKLFVSPGDSKNYAAAIYYKTAAGTETSVIGAISATADWIGISVWEIGGLATATLIEIDGDSGTTSPIKHPAMAAGEAAIRFVLFGGLSNASEVDDPTGFTNVAYTGGPSSSVIARSSYRITTNPIALFSNAISLGGWLTLGIVYGAAPIVTPSQQTIFFMTDW